MKGAKREHLWLRLIGAAWIVLLGHAAWQLAWEANGTGALLGRFSAGWLQALIAYTIVGGLLGLVGLAAVLRPTWLEDRLAEPAEGWATRLGRARWPIVGVLLILPTGLVFGPTHEFLAMSGLRAIVLFLAAGAAAMVMPDDRLSRPWRLAYSVLFSAGAFVVTREFVVVVDYPFKLAWSEGNRIWDYSLYFARERYEFAGAFHYPTYMAPGRHGLFGLPFLIPDAPIWLLRLWKAVLWTAPFLIFGALLAHREQWGRQLQGAFTLWAFLFLALAAVKPPLILSGVLLALAFRRSRPGSNSIAAGVASFYAGISRWTWLVAPAVWATVWALVEARGDKLKDRIIAPGIVAVGGLVGGLGSRLFMDTFFPEPGPVYGTAFSQDLLWYRLLPSPTNPIGLVPGLLLVTVPIVTALLFAGRRGWFRWDWLQWAGTGAAFTALLAVGLVASVKIGGGNNLHNFDMFLVGLVILAAVAGRQMLESGYWNEFITHRLVRAAVALAIVVPAWWVLRSGGPLSLPSPEVTGDSLAQLRQQVQAEAADGEVLFIDQRQLLTFGQIQDVPLVLDYELKHLMNQAMGDNAPYLQQFERDLARGRFELIIVDPQRIQYQGRTHAFGEENDAWVEHVASALLEHYEPSLQLNQVGVWAMVPKGQAEQGS